MRNMLYAAAGDIATQTNNKIQFFVDTVGVGSSGLVQRLRLNCYLRVPTASYSHLLFQVTTPVGGPWPASVATPEGEEYPDIDSEAKLTQALGEILQRDRTKEILAYLLSLAP
jgi:hypothetical protein